MMRASMKPKPPSKPSTPRRATASPMLSKLLGGSPTSAATLKDQRVAQSAQYAQAMQCFGQKEWESALAHVKALQAQPQWGEIDHITLLNFEATLLACMNQLEAAVQIYQTLVARAPQHVDALANLGLALQKLQRYPEALPFLQRATALQPQHVNAQLNLGLLYQTAGQFDEADQCYQRVLALAPQHEQGLFNVAKLLQDRHRFDEAMQAYETLLRHHPRHADGLANLIFLQHYRYPCDLAAHARLSQRSAALYPSSTAAVHRTRSASQRPLRVGLVSADFRQHPVGYFLRDVLHALAQTAVASGQLQLLAYANQSEEDALTHDLARAFSAWQRTLTWSDDRLAAQIRADAVDVLIDLSGRTAGNRLAVFARQPAPVQLSWLGYFASTGLPQIDAIVADPVCVPPGEEHLYTEHVLRLPETRLCMSPPLPHVAAPSRTPAVVNGYLTLGCVQALPKINAGVLAAWAAILQACASTRLRIQSAQIDHPPSRAAFLARLQAAGLPLDRITLHGAQSRADYLRSLQQVDILLDTFPYPGGTTTAEALWMGVPTLTLAQPGMLARQGQSLLNAVGLQADWVAHTESDYIARAIAWGQGGSAQWQALQALRASLPQRAAASPLFDAPRFAAAWWQAVQGVWAQKMAVLSGQAIDLR